ncbi:MAG: pyridoxal phosphate-dependent aminotransferase [Spirochaetota bacterium]
MKLAQRAMALKPSATLAISARAKELAAAGKDVLDFGVGEPDFPTPRHIVDATITALNNGRTKYSPASGTPELKQAVSGYYKKKYGLSYSVKEIVINAGAKHSLYNIFQAIIDPGDEVILPAPYWVSYPPQIEMAGGTVVVVTADDTTDFRVSAAEIEKAITKRTKALVLNSPSNPTGSVYTKEELTAIADACVSRGVYIIYDEIYENNIYGRQHVCLATLSEKVREHTILVNGASKSYAMTGYRIGYILGPADLISAVGNIQSHSTSNPTTFCMDATVAAITGPEDAVNMMRAEFEKRRDVFVAGMRTIPGVTCTKPDGAFYILPNFKGVLGKAISGKVYTTTQELAKGMLEDELIACVPGEEFGAPGYIRFSYATSMATIEKAIARIRAWLSK